MYVQRLGALAFTSVLTLLQTITFVIGFLMIPIFLFFVLLSTQRLPRAVDQLLHPAIRSDAWNIWRIVDHVLGNYVRSQLILGVIVGVATYGTLWSLRFLGIEVPYALLLAVIAGMGELIPIVGPILSAIPAMIAVSNGGIGTILLVAALYFVIQQLESQILVPRIVGGTLRLNPALLLLILVVGASAGGLLLVIAAPPLAAMSRDVYRYGQRRLGEPPLPPAPAMEGLLVGREAAQVAPQEQPAPF
jgi:predicted PurR-regulated permease PerM